MRQGIDEEGGHGQCIDKPTTGSTKVVTHSTEVNVKGCSIEAFAFNLKTPSPIDGIAVVTADLLIWKGIHPRTGLLIAGEDTLHHSMLEFRMSE